MIFIEIIAGVVAFQLAVLLVFFITMVSEYMGVNPIDDVFDRFFTWIDKKAKAVAGMIEMKVFR